MLSGGQKQRISIARELYKKTEIIVLDEATSSLDSTTETLIRENLKNLNGLVTFIIIAHRLSTIQNADNIVLLNDGKIAATGTFDQLMKSSELFRTRSNYKTPVMPLNNISISVIIPVFNNGSALQRAIDSCLNQSTFRNNSGG